MTVETDGKGVLKETLKNVLFWDIKTLFVLHRRHITSPLQSSAI
jgi:alpha-mannosidase